jgi:Glycosyltransferase family 87
LKDGAVAAGGAAKGGAGTAIRAARIWFLLPAGAAVMVVCGLAVFTLWYIMSKGGVGYDAHAYWLAGRSAHPYQGAPGQYNAFLYSPVFVLLMRPLALMSWPWFVTVWLVAETSALAWLVAPLRWRWRIPLLVLAMPEVAMGNIYGFLGVAAVAGLRRPEAWAFPLLTKVTPGGVGLLWFAARGEWSKVARAATFTCALSALSFVITPGLWREWVSFLIDHGGDTGARVPLLLCVAGILTVVAARSNQRWLLSVAMMIAVPTFTGKNKDLAMLVAAPRLQRDSPLATTPKRRYAAPHIESSVHLEHRSERLEVRTDTFKE